MTYNNAYINYDLTASSNFFGNLCRNLKIQTIPAFSPQAKGRVERSNRTHQDRLIPKLRINKITTNDSANKYLYNYYLPNHNKKFALPIQEDTHRKLPDKAKLDDFAYEITEQKVAKVAFLLWKNINKLGVCGVLIFLLILSVNRFRQIKL
ncbi:MAG: hypothetical protein IJ529_00050 [Alphaproteobacteria bacterium]|nr:hypothetical protein [Alphaproteobacteria bacterium]MBQ9235098.1 hypothetical protein [Alphaproteobacteria bacterium]